MPELEARLEKARLARDQDRQAQILARPPIAPRVVQKRPAAEPAGDAVEDDAAPSALEERPAFTPDSAPAPFDEEGPVWPDSSAEAAFLAEQGPVSIAAPRAKAEVDTKVPLPALDALVARIPASTKAALEELFRARFVSVKRIQQDWLKE